MTSTEIPSLSVADSPIVVLFEDRPKQRMVFQLNMSVYLDARVVVASDLAGLKRALAGSEGVQLVVARSSFREGAIVAEIMAFLRESKQQVPVIVLGQQAEAEGLVALGDDNLVKPLLQSAARILGVTARKMVGKVRPDHYRISSDFLRLLFSFPCDIYEERPGGRARVFSTGEKVSRSKVNKLVRANAPLIIDSLDRLRLANAITEQSQQASEEMRGDSVGSGQKMAMVSSSLDMVAEQFKNAGMDPEIIELANASITAIEKIAETSTSVDSLLRQLKESGGDYRYTHAQLITFLGFHVIKMMGWWGDEQRTTLSQAAFYHDVSLEHDEDAKIRTELALKKSGIKDEKRIENILSHAQLAARELQAAVPAMGADTVRIVIQHHGSPVGRGFSTDIAELDNLSKAFILAEEWADYLIELSESDAEPDNEGRAAALKQIYTDEISQQIVETFRYLDPDAFASDFLDPGKVATIEAVDVEVSGAAANDAAPSAGKPGEPAGAYRGDGEKSYLNEEEAALVDELLPEGSRERAAFQSASGSVQKLMLEKLRKKKLAGGQRRAAEEPGIAAALGEAGAVPERTVKGVSESRHDEERALSGAAGGQELGLGGEGPATRDREGGKAVRSSKAGVDRGTERTVEGGGDGQADQEAGFAGDDPEADAIERTVEGVTDKTDTGDFLSRGGKQEADRTRRAVKGVTDVRRDEESSFEGDDPEADDTERTLEGVTDKTDTGDFLSRGGKQEVDRTKRAVKGVTDVRKDEELRFAGDEPEIDDTETTVEDVTEKTDTGDFLSRGGKQEVDRTKRTVEGVTEVRKDEAVVVKDDPQKLVERSLAKKVDSAKDAKDAKGERELKMKSTGATDLMKVCLAGDVDSIKELLEADSSSGHLRKVDGEGRTALHYAAMGGSAEAVKLLLEKGAPLNTLDSKRRSALFLSALHKQNEVFDHLLSQGAKIVQQATGGMTIAMVAAFTNNLHILKTAVQKKVRLDTVDHSGKTVNDYAKQAKATEILNFLQALKEKGPAKRGMGTGGTPQKKGG